MKVAVIGGRELSPDLRALWNRMLDATPETESAFLRPEYTVAVASSCDDEGGGRAIGFLPFKRGPLRTEVVTKLVRRGERWLRSE